VVSGRCRNTMERSGARSGRSRSGNGAGITEIGWSVERLFHRSRSALMIPLEKQRQVWFISLADERGVCR